MQKMWLCGLLGSLLAGMAQAAPWSSFVPKGQHVFQQLTTDLNGDGRPDKVLITEGADDQTPRRLLVLLGTPGGYHLSASSDQVVKCRGCGGVWGDPFGDLTAGRGWLQVSDYGGSSWKWGNTYRFVWRRHEWQLSQYGQYEHNPYVHDKATDIPPSECQDTRLNHFVCGLTIHSELEGNYQVTTKRAYFYDTPSLKNKLPSYLIAGDRLSVYTRYKHFVYGAYTKENDDGFTEGYFRLTDLKELKKNHN